MGGLSGASRPHEGDRRSARTFDCECPEVAAAIIGTRSSKHVDGNAALIGRTLPPEAVARIDAFLAGFPTVDGDCFDLERLDGSKHRAIMRMNLVNSVDGK